MKYFHLVWAALFRRKTRTTLTRTILPPPTLRIFLVVLSVFPLLASAP